jgi:hypothetical protein
MDLFLKNFVWKLFYFSKRGNFFVWYLIFISNNKFMNNIWKNATTPQKLQALELGTSQLAVQNIASVL